MGKFKEQLKKPTTWTAIAAVGVVFAVPPETIEIVHSIFEFFWGA